MSLACQLGRLVGQTPASEEELRVLRAAAWHQQGILVIVPERVQDARERHCLLALATRLYGKRHG